MQKRLIRSLLQCSELLSFVFSVLYIAVSLSCLDASSVQSTFHFPVLLSILSVIFWMVFLLVSLLSLLSFIHSFFLSVSYFTVLFFCFLFFFSFFKLKLNERKQRETQHNKEHVHGQNKNVSKIL
jgi:phosphotransferase system  glucose/maltose/N-acetylglucosamine-specific IIC component